MLLSAAAAALAVALCCARLLCVLQPEHNLSVRFVPGAPAHLTTRSTALQVHLFDVDVPNGPVLMESRYTAPGSQVRLLGAPTSTMKSTAPDAAAPATLGLLSAPATARPRPGQHRRTTAPERSRHTRPNTAAQLPLNAPAAHARAQLVACDSPVGHLGLSVCYDLRFPELYQRLAWDLGAQVLLVPSAFTVTTGGMAGWGLQQGGEVDRVALAAEDSVSIPCLGPTCR